MNRLFLSSFWSPELPVAAYLCAVYFFNKKGPGGVLSRGVLWAGVWGAQAGVSGPGGGSCRLHPSVVNAPSHVLPGAGELGTHPTLRSRTLDLSVPPPRCGFWD